jgi:hypothetical protein
MNDFVERQTQLDFYRKLLARLESIDITQDEGFDKINDTIRNGLDEINTTLKRFGSYMPEPTHPKIMVGVE